MSVSARAQGYAFPHLTRRLDIAGRHVTTHLAELLRRRGHAPAAAASTDALRQLKERLCYVAADLAREQKVRGEACEEITFRVVKAVSLGAMLHGRQPR